MKLDNEYEMVVSGLSIDIVKETGRNQKGEPIKKSFHYGTVYQAIVGYVNLKTKDIAETEDGLLSISDGVAIVMKAIEEARVKIKQDFCCDVVHVK